MGVVIAEIGDAQSVKLSAYVQRKKMHVKAFLNGWAAVALLFQPLGGAVDGYSS